MRIDPETGRVLKEIEVPGSPKFIRAGFGSLWVIPSEKDLVCRIFPSSDVVEARIAVPSNPRRVAIGANSIWVGIRPTGLAVDENWLWVADGYGDIVSKIRVPTRR